MSFIYTRTQLKASINRFIQNKQGLLIDFGETCNTAVREVLSDIDMRSLRRKSSLTPNLFNGEYDYACPSDLKAYSIIDIPQQAKRDDGEFNLIPSREFAINKRSGDIAIDDYNGVRILKINSKVADKTVVASELDSIYSGGGTWTVKGDATTLVADSDDYVKGNGSLKFSISSAGGTTAGIQNISLNTIDLTNYVGGNGALFVWVKINSITGLTNYVLEIGTNTSNYYKKTVTTQNDGTAFVNGWNLLRFDLTSLAGSGSGTPTDTTINYISIYMTKLGSKISESDYKFDYIVLKSGKNADVKYYSKYGWQTAAGAYIENSTLDTDVLVCDTDEFELFVKKGVYIAGQEIDLTAGGRNPLIKLDDLNKQYLLAIKQYQMKNPSECSIMTSEYYKY